VKRSLRPHRTERAFNPWIADDPSPRFEAAGAEADAGQGGGGAGGESAADFGSEALQTERVFVERLMHFAAALEHDVVIEIRAKAKAAKKGKILIVGAA